MQSWIRDLIWNSSVGPQSQLAIDLACKHLSTLILPDFASSRSPGAGSAFQITKQRAQAAHSLIVTSADAEPERVEAFSAAGAEAYLSKSLDIIAFYKMVDEQIGKRQ